MGCLLTAYPKEAKADSPYRMQALTAYTAQL